MKHPYDVHCRSDAGDSFEFEFADYLNAVILKTIQSKLSDIDDIFS